MCYLPLVVNNMVQCQFLSFVFVVREYFLTLNENLEKHHGEAKLNTKRKTKDKTQLDIIIFAKKIHFELCGLGKIINNLFSIQILFLIGDNFISFTSLSYFCFISFSKLYSKEEFNPYQTFTTLYWSTSKLIQIFILSVVCSSATYEVSKFYGFYWIFILYFTI